MWSEGLRYGGECGRWSQKMERRATELSPVGNTNRNMGLSEIFFTCPSKSCKIEKTEFLTRIQWLGLPLNPLSIAQGSMVLPHWAPKFTLKFCKQCQVGRRGHLIQQFYIHSRMQALRYATMQFSNTGRDNLILLTHLETASGPTG